MSERYVLIRVVFYKESLYIVLLKSYLIYKYKGIEYYNKVFFLGWVYESVSSAFYFIKKQIHIPNREEKHSG